VAVVGAGISGVCAAVYLLKYDLEVKVFERASVAGGAWHFDPRVSDDPTFPSEAPSVGDYVRSLAGQFSDAGDDILVAETETNGTTHPLHTADEAALSVSFSPPGPCYAGLTNNVPTHLMVSALAPWPTGTPPNTTQDVIEQYVQALAASHGAHAVTEYDTRVDEISKAPGQEAWAVRTLRLRGGRVEEQTRRFDAVVVASGHYNLPRVPGIPGLKDWKALFPAQVIHAKQYRTPETFRGRNVLLIGAGTSALDICRESEGIANKLYQSTRGGQFDIPAVMMPPSVERVGEVERFHVPSERTITSPDLPGHNAPSAGEVIFRDGTVLKDIHHIVVATGYITSYPFLPQFHSDTVLAHEAGPELLVTAEGNMVHNLHKDIFFIDDPTLSFVGVPYHTATFSLFDFQAQVVARVLAGRAILPSTEAMRDEYQRRVRDEGLGRGFHSLKMAGREIEYVKELVDWVNRDAARLGIPPMLGHAKSWIDEYWALREKWKALFSTSK